ncbi:unnamed protein product [Brachionus calyciflorus]|uniref:Uncharacterized protein n=1 Tax=Brachionus calyciflorus TaxID=104777 RepID=A0A814JYW0_9BILA|nr:unnamed protein product [Brachionus calyciflorus]
MPQKNYGINYPKIELEKINLNQEFLTDDSFYSYSPSANPSLQLIGNDPNIASTSIQQNNINQTQPSPLTHKNIRSKLANDSPSNRIITGIKRANSEEEDNLYFSQEKNLIKNARH